MGEGKTEKNWKEMMKAPRGLKLKEKEKSKSNQKNLKKRSQHFLLCFLSSSVLCIYGVFGLTGKVNHIVCSLIVYAINFKWVWSNNAWLLVYFQGMVYMLHCTTIDNILSIALFYFSSLYRLPDCFVVLLCTGVGTYNCCAFTPMTAAGTVSI